MVMSTEAVNRLSEESGRRSSPPPSARPWKQAAGNQLRARTYYTAPATTSSCASCKGHHPIWKCAAFKAINAAERWKIAKGKNLCHQCLSSDHVGKDCPWDKACGKDGCAQHHHYLLYTDRAVAAPRRESSAQAPANTEGESAMISSSSSSKSIVALRTIPVRLSNGTGSSIIVNALLNDASTRTYVSNHFAGTLDLDDPRRTLIIGKLNDQEEEIQTRLVSRTISDLDDAMTSELSAGTVEKPAGRLKATKWQDVQHQWNHLQHICFPMMPSKRGIDILIGADHPELHLALQEKQGAAGEPTARLTPLGWTCVGPVAKDTSLSSTTLATYTFLSMGAVHEDVTRSLAQLWKMEKFNAANTPRLTMEEKKPQGVVDASIRQTNGLYEVAIPWRDGRPTSLPHNHEMAEKRLAQLMKRLDKDPVVAKAYRDVVDGHVTKGYVRKVPVHEVKPSVQWLLPHYAIVRSDKTTKVRPVFDAAAKYCGVSLSDLILPGPKLQRELPAVLLRFRRRPVALICDIAEMYLQITLAVEDRPFHRFLWHTKTGEQATYEFQRVVFGVNASPFLAQHVSRVNAEKSSQYPRVAESLLSSTYMDDSMDSVDIVDEAITSSKELRQLWQACGMHPRNWLSNSMEVLQHVPPAYCAKEIDLEDGQVSPAKTLRVLWKATCDQFAFRLKTPSAAQKMTKRAFLRATAKVFDPLGFVAPFVIRAKLCLQEMWLTGQDWDQELTHELNEKTTAWFDDFSAIERINVPRCLVDEQRGVPVNTSLHVFADASEKAYGAVAYFRAKYLDSTVSRRFVAGKTRVAPLTALSIPRLGLLAATVAVDHASASVEGLNMNMDTDVVFWTDSRNVLHWITNLSRSFKPFVAARVGDIQQHTQPSQWHPVPTKVNPADILSRGMSGNDLVNSELWWNGPAFLELGTGWPEQIVPDVCHTELEKKAAGSNATALISTTAVPDGPKWRLDPQRFSSWQRLCRYTAWVLRFLQNCRTKPTDQLLGE